MFDFGISELLMIVIVAIIVFKPEDLPNIIKSVVTFFATVRAYCTEITKEFSDITDEVNVKKDVMGHIEDLEGHIQETYDLSELEEYYTIEENKDSKKESTKNA